jgi:hypothetical protein
MTPQLHADLEREIARLARAGTGAAEIRRLLIPLAARLGVPRPGYTAIRVLVVACREDVRYEVWEPTASPLDSLVKGRMPTLDEVEQLLERRRRRRLVD